MRVVRIFGPPGTGKTTALSEMIRKSASTYGGRVAVTSFTKTAALELRGRDLPLPEGHVGTLHSMGYRALGCPPILDADKDLRAAWNEIAPPGWEIRYHRANSVDDPYSDRGGHKAEEELLHYHLIRATGEEPNEWTLDTAAVYEEFKEREGCIDFTDMIEHPLRLGLAAPIEAAIWYHDETQDSNRMELELLHQWAGACPAGLVLAGDDQQAIYGFRGATAQAFLEGEAEERVLGRSYRLPPQIQEYAHRYGETMDRRREKVWTGRPDAEGRVREIGFAHDMDADDLLPLLEGEGSVMFLASCGYMLNTVLANLRELGVGFCNPYRPTHAPWNPLAGLPAVRVSHYLNPAPSYGDVAAWLNLIPARDHFPHGSVTKLRRRIEEEEIGAEEFPKEDFEALFGMPYPDADLDWLEERIGSRDRDATLFAIRVARRGGRGALKNPRVRVGTIHSVKGGEADRVILFPDTSAKAEKVAMLTEDRDEIRRMFYVGMTRAREELVLAAPAEEWRGHYEMFPGVA